jgi:hypothetical protein
MVVCYLDSQLVTAAGISPRRLLQLQVSIDGEAQEIFKKTCSNTEEGAPRWGKTLACRDSGAYL